VVRIIVVGGFPNVVISQRLRCVFVSTAGPPGVRVTTGREGNGSLHVLDGRRGTIVRTWPLVWLPGPMAMDGRHRDGPDLATVQTEAAVPGGGHKGSAWEVRKTCRGPLRHRRHAGSYPLEWPVRAQPPWLLDAH
jgi:hypothetical protein